MDFSLPVVLGQLLLGLINGANYATLSLGLAIIFGLLHVTNFTHGAQYALGAFVAWMLLQYVGIGYWPALILAPLIVGLTGMAMERYMLRRVYRLEHIYGFLLTFGLALIIEGCLREAFGISGQPYDIPELLSGGIDLGFTFLPLYRLWVVAFSAVVCFATWFLIEKTPLGARLRAATENPLLTQTFGINVPAMVTIMYGCGVALAGLSGVIVAPIYEVGALMGDSVLPVIFAVVVIGGLTSIRGAIMAGFLLGAIEGLTKVFWPSASSTVIFVLMALMIVVRPAGLFGSAVVPSVTMIRTLSRTQDLLPIRRSVIIAATVLLLAAAVAAPFVFYPLFVTEALCYALLACSFNLLLGFGGLMSFGHAAFFGAAAYVTAYTMKEWGLDPIAAILLATLAGTAVGAIFGWVAIHRQQVYFGMITLALGQVVYFYAADADWTNSENGIQAVPAGKLLGLVDLHDPYALYYFILAIFLFGFALVWRIIHSPFGHVLKAIRENEPRATSLGYKIERYKLQAFILSAGLAALAGAAKACAFHLASLTDVDWTMSGQAVLMTLVGGLGTMLGPVVGAFAIVGMQNYLAGFGSLVTIIQGIVFVLCVFAFRKGAVGWVLYWLGRWPATGALTARTPPEPAGERAEAR